MGFASVGRVGLCVLSPFLGAGRRTASGLPLGGEHERLNGKPSRSSAPSSF